jgi:poly-gamma-glutamate capsule biosynthesis protein CapA/YwtB (metallophosphatase superfamily)
MLAGPIHLLVVLLGLAAVQALPEDRADLAAVGDLQLALVMREAGELVDGDPFAGVRELLRADLTLGNLEGPMTPPGAVASPQSDGPVLRQPADTPALLRRAGFDAVSLANNHVLDYGVAAALHTRAALEASGVPVAGVWDDPESRFHPLLRSAGGLTVGILAYTHWLNVPQGWRAVGLGSFREDDPASEIRALRPYVDFVVVLAHWEYEDDAASYGHFRDLGAALVDAGADLVIGSHPHVLKGLEWRNGALIAYSLGNFVFGPEDGARAEGAVLRVTLARDGLGRRRLREARIVPVRLAGPRGTPVPAEGPAADRLRRRVDGLSQSLGTRIDADGRVRPDDPAQAGVLPARVRYFVAL